MSTSLLWIHKFKYKCRKDYENLACQDVNLKIFTQM